MAQAGRLQRPRYRVYVVKQKGRRNLVLQCYDRKSGKKVGRTSGTARRSVALREAGVWEAQLNDRRLGVWTPEEIALVFKCPVIEVHELIRSGRLHGFYLGSPLDASLFRVSHDKLIDFIRGNTPGFCAVCGRAIVSKGRPKTCSTDCHLIRLRRVSAEASRKARAKYSALEEFLAAGALHELTDKENRGHGRATDNADEQ